MRVSGIRQSVTKSARFSHLETKANEHVDDGVEMSASPLGEAKINEGNADRKSKSFISTTSSLGTSSTIREITETWTHITLKMKWNLLALIFNLALIVTNEYLKTGFVVDFPVALIENYSGVLFEVILLFNNIITLWGVEEAASCLFGYLLSQKKGFSLAVCGYLQTPSFSKMSFSQTLSLTSPSRKIFARISFIWIVLELLKVLIPFCAIALSSSQYAIFNDVSDCVYFGQDASIGPTDRGWPKFETEVGVGEYVFGSSLGIMRSEMSGVNFTTAQYPPTLISALNNGDTIQGFGYTVDISTLCSCVGGVDEESFVSIGVPQIYANKTIANFLAMNGQPGLTFDVMYNSTNDSLALINVIGGYNLCGGNGQEQNVPLICTTTMKNHNLALLQISFQTDGTSASICPNVASLVSPIGKADIENWLLFGMLAITNGPTSYFLTPPTVPGSLSPILWWTSPNLIAVDRAAIEAGIETMYSILFKGAIQRTYTPLATQCVRKNTVISTQSTIQISYQGYLIGNVIHGTQMAMTVLSILAFSLWYMTSNPIGPAVRATRESIYVITLLTASPHLGIGLSDLCNGETYLIWQKLDAVCRIGESLETLEDEIGKIIVDKPRLVRAIQNGKKYY